MTSGADESQAWCAVRQYDSPKAICSCIHSLRVDSFQSPPEPARHQGIRVCDDCTMSALRQKGIVVCLEVLEPRRSLSTHYRGFGGGLGFGTPVVSYAPRPILSDVPSLVIMEACGMA